MQNVGYEITRDSACRAMEVVSDDGKPVAYAVTFRSGEQSESERAMEHGDPLTAVLLPDRMLRELFTRWSRFQRTLGEGPDSP